MAQPPNVLDRRSRPRPVDNRRSVAKPRSGPLLDSIIQAMLAKLHAEGVQPGQAIDLNALWHHLSVEMGVRQFDTIPAAGELLGRGYVRHIGDDSYQVALTEAGFIAASRASTQPMQQMVSAIRDLQSAV
ncbi:hypothetical protein [Abyssibacter profundi]|uniref:Uncharacterized protein n=1 Tax=Abyssibacter profundi TaxID=2182787 RepID=A0A383XPX9_9GAMM|nr:hypothetical protein [Abyssibacter profundi]PWN54683.1 hypothetical protein DEH80_16390 [Abyssibacter profundi]